MSARVDRQRDARARVRVSQRELEELRTRELARAHGNRGALALALALLRSMPVRGNWRMTSLWAPGCQCRMCGRVLRNKHVRAVHLSLCTPKFFAKWPVTLAEFLRRCYSADELAAIAAMCAGLAGGSR